METKTFVAYADMTSFKSRVNHTVDITFNMSETSSSQVSQLLPYLNQQGVLAFKVGEFDTEELEALPEPKPEFSNEKSPSERLRNVLFVLHKQRGGDPTEFELFRKAEMERIIAMYKNQLSPV